MELLINVRIELKTYINRNYLRSIFFFWLEIPIREKYSAENQLEINQQPALFLPNQRVVVLMHSRKSEPNEDQQLL